MQIHGFTENGYIDATIDDERMTVPDDPANRHRQMIAQWEAQGNTIPAYVPPAPQPRTLNRIQFEFMVEKLGIAAAIDAAIEAMPETTEAEQNAKIMARVLKRSGQEFVRSHPLFTVLAPAVGVTSDQIDEAWAKAEALTW